MKRTHLLASAVAFGLLGPGLASPAGADYPSYGTPAYTQLAAQSLPYSKRNVQQLLNDLGYNVGTPDGVIGAKSRAAIRAFQVDNGLPASGEPSLALFERLQQVWAQRYQRAQTTAAASTPVASADANLVLSIQQELGQRGYNVPQSGQLDAQTVAAIRDYQRSARMTVNGQPSQDLLARLEAAPRSGSARYTAQQVMQVQTALDDMGYDVGAIDGVTGPKLREAIRLYQTREGLSATGQINSELLASLNISGTSTAAAAGSQALQIERELQALGYNVGTVDGSIDAQARQAIRQYQQNAGLTVNGQASGALLSHIRSGGQSQAAASTSTTSTARFLRIEQLLQQRGYDVGSVDGKLDATARSAIREYQQEAGLAVTGNASSDLLTHLEATGTTGSTAAVTAAPSQAVVLDIEKRLKAKGYSVGPVDGKVDAQTTNAISTYQRHAGLTINGQASSNLRDHIRTSNIDAKSGAIGDAINTIGTIIQSNQ